MTYISPCDLMAFLIEKYPSILVGGLQCPTERAQNLRTFWDGFKLQHADHEAFKEHPDNLQNLIPIAWHGDEGRGKRRGNTVVVSCQAIIGLHTVLQKRKRRATCECDPPISIQNKFSRSNVDDRLSAESLSVLLDQRTNMKGHSFIQHFALFIIPSWVHHAYPQVLPEMLKIVANDFKRLFYEGVTFGNKHFCFAVTAAKGDLKWFCKIALQRSFQNQGFVRDQACCHECQAGEANLPWEELSDRPAWSNSRYTQRPWGPPGPSMIETPFCRAAPEKMYKRDPFHLCKVGIYRDLAGSCICWMVHKGYYGSQGDFGEKLMNCHGVFKLFCTATGRTAALRTFSRAFFMYPTFAAFPWVNAKGADTMILLKFIAVQCTGFLQTPLRPEHSHTLTLMRTACQGAIGFFSILNAHGLFMERSCAMAAYTELTKFLKGYGMLAGASLNDTFNGWAIKPKLHLVKHAHLEIQEWLLAGHQVLVNFNLHNCEQDEDYIGRVCRLSRRLDSRRIGERVLQSCLLKSHLLYKNFLKDNKICQRWRWKWIVGSDGVWERFPDVPQWFPNILFHPFSWQSCLIIVMFRLGYILQSPNTSEWSSIGIVAR